MYGHNASSSYDGSNDVVLDLPPTSCTTPNPHSFSYTYTQLTIITSFISSPTPSSVEVCSSNAHPYTHSFDGASRILLKIHSIYKMDFLTLLHLLRSTVTKYVNNKVLSIVRMERARTVRTTLTRQTEK